MTVTDNVETKARRRIRQAVESRGFKLVSLTWEPWSNGGEKSGICGGWFGELDRQTHPFPDAEIMGLSVDETVCWVDEFVPTPEPCDCDPPTYPGPLQSSEPTFMHEEGCPWRLRYWLRWWGPKPSHNGSYPPVASSPVGEET
jgi:hypothetical protein